MASATRLALRSSDPSSSSIRHLPLHVAHRLPTRGPRSCVRSQRLHREFRRDSGRTAAAGRSRARSPPSACESLREMARLARPGAHAFRAHVQEMRGLGRRISDAASRSSAAIDQHRCDATAGKLRGEDGARSTASDNRDRDDPVRFRSQANSPDLPSPPCAATIWSLHPRHGLACGLGEPAGHERVDEAGRAGADQRRRR